MRWCALLLVLTASAQERQGNRFAFHSSAGAAELEWISASSFRFRRTFAPLLPARSNSNAEAVDITVKQSAAETLFTTMYLKTIVRKDDLRVEVRKAADDGIVMKDLTPAARRGGVISWERLAEPGVHYYGLGGKTGDSLNLRGARIADAVPFLLSTDGYGEQHVAPGRYDFDLARLRRGSYRIDIRDAEVIDYYFFYGPTPKEVFEERLKTSAAKFAPHRELPGFRWLLEQSLSGIILPAETVTQPVPPELRKRLGAYLGAYIQEVHDRGCPILHPLPVQFPRDPEADKYTEETMLGDELLLATGRSAYLPQGIWTNLRSNTVTRGRQTVRTEDAPSIFARNGSIVPLAGSGTLELHYFPKLGAEFFLYEEDAGDYSQVHAAPAADIMRLEIESKVVRDYTWVVHHIEGVTSVTLGEASLPRVKTTGDLRDRTWYYDASLQNLYVRDRVAAGQDHIVNLSFE